MFRYRLLVAMFAGLAVAAAAHAAPAFPGDLDGDGYVSVADAVAALEMAGGMAAVDTNALAIGDVAGTVDSGANYADGRVTIADAVRIFRAASGLDDLGDGGATPPSPPNLLSKDDTLTISGASVIRNYALQRGIILSGVLKTTAGHPVRSDEVDFTPPGSSYSIYSAGTDTLGRYTVALPAGNYAVSAQRTFDVAEGGDYSEATSTVPASISISADASKDFVENAFTAPGTLAGGISTPGITVSNLDAYSYNGQFGDASTPVKGATFHLPIGPGQYGLSLSGNYTPDADVNWLAYFAAPVSVATNATTTRSLAAPASVLMTGTATPPAGATLYHAAVDNFDPNAAKDEYVSYYTIPDAPPDTPPSNVYKLAAPPGNYLGYFSVRTDDEEFSFDYLVNYTIPAGGGTKNITLPPLPPTFTFSGTVTDDKGMPDPNAYVSAYPVNQAVNTYSLYNGGDTDAAGHFAFMLPNGAYDVSIDDYSH